MSALGNRIHLIKHRAPLGAELRHGVVPRLPVPAACRAQLSDLASFDFEHQKSPVGAQDQKVPFPVLCIIIAPANNPLVGQPGQKFGHAKLRLIAAVQRPVVNPFCHKPLLPESQPKSSRFSLSSLSPVRSSHRFPRPREPAGPGRGSAGWLSPIAPPGTEGPFPRTGRTGRVLPPGQACRRPCP